MTQWLSPVVQAVQQTIEISPLQSMQPVEISQAQFLDKVMQPVEIPQAQFLDKVICPVVCKDRLMALTVPKTVVLHRCSS